MTSATGLSPHGSFGIGMRWRGMPVHGNSIRRSAQRGPGYNQLVHIIEPLLDKAARELKVDRLAIRLLNAPETRSPVGAKRTPVASCYLKDALANTNTLQDAVMLRASRPGRTVGEVYAATMAEMEERGITVEQLGAHGG